jgi:hypothetical protein
MDNQNRDRHSNGQASQQAGRPAGITLAASDLPTIGTMIPA